MVHESRLESVDVTLHSPRSRWNKKIVHVDMYVQFPCLLESGLSSLVGNDFNEKNLKSELTIVILISNKNFLNHDSPEINRLIMLHVTKKCWRPFRHWQRQTWEEGVRNSRWAKAFLKMAGLFWLLYHQKILCKLKQMNSWTGDKQFSPAIIWQLSTATSAGPLHFFIRFSKRSVVHVIVGPIMALADI